MEDVSDVFKCFICINTVEDARLCPSCSKLCCYQCIRRWLTEEKENCPCCRTPLKLDDLINCRWAGRVTKQIDKMQNFLDSNQSSSSLNITEAKDQCASHKVELNVYCLTCQECICYHCAIWSTEHKKHSLRPLSEIYNQHSDKHLKNNKELHDRLKDLLSLFENLETNRNVIQESQEESINEIQKCAENMITRINSSVAEKMKVIDQRKLRLNQEIMNVRFAQQEIEELLDSGYSDLIRNSERLQANFETFQTKPVSSFFTKPVSLDHTSELVPLFDTTTFTINNFSHLKQQADPIYSQALHSSGSSWKLKVYPDGNAAARGEYLSVFLELSSSLVKASAYDYRIEMVHQNNQDSRSIVREFSSVFAIGESWGYIRFFRLDLLVQEGFHDTINDVLVLKFQVRPQTYFQKCKELQYQIDHLKEEQIKHKEQIKNLSMNKAHVQNSLHFEQSNGDVASTSKLTDAVEEKEHVASPIYKQQLSPSVENKEEVSINETHSSFTDQNREDTDAEEDEKISVVWLSENDIDFETMSNDNTIEDIIETSSTVSSVSSEALMSHENPLTKSSIPPPFFSYFTCSLPHQILSSETLENSPQPSSSQSKPPEKVFFRPNVCDSSDIYQSLTSSNHSLFSQKPSLVKHFPKHISHPFGPSESVKEIGQRTGICELLGNNYSLDSSDDEHLASTFQSLFSKKQTKLGEIKNGDRKFTKRSKKRIKKNTFEDTNSMFDDTFNISYPTLSEVQGLSLSELPVHKEDDLSDSSNETTSQSPPAEATTEQVIVEGGFILDSSDESGSTENKIDSHQTSEAFILLESSSDSDEADEEHEDDCEQNQTNDE